MRLTEYKDLIELEFGEVTIPKTDEDVEKILDEIWNSMEVISVEDYRLFQAMLVIIDWRNKNEYFERKDKSIRERY